jgi:hypothetical protein
VTSTLSNILGTNANSNLGSVPFLLTLRFGEDRSHCRMGLDFHVKNQHQPASVFTAENTQNENVFKYRAGWGSIVPVAKTFAFYWGLDGLLSFDNSKVTTNDVQTGVRSTTSSNAWGLGAGPVIGFHWQVHPHIILSTESSIYAMYVSSKQTVDANPDNLVVKNDTFTWEPLLPTSLFINFVF